MAITSKDIVPLTQARARLTELIEEINSNSGEKIITKNGESCAALIDAERLDYYHRLDRLKNGFLQPLRRENRHYPLSGCSRRL